MSGLRTFIACVDSIDRDANARANQQWRDQWDAYLLRDAERDDRIDAALADMRLSQEAARRQVAEWGL